MKKNLAISTVNEKTFIREQYFIKTLKTALAKKNILLSDIVLNTTDSKTYLALKIFFRHKKIKFYKNKIKKPKKKYFLSFNQLLFQQLLNKNVNYLFIYNLNKKVNLALVLEFLKEFKRFKNILFTRRTDLFSDFINTSALLVKGLINSRLYLLILTQIFSIILKQKHTPYFLFLHLLLKKLIKNKKQPSINTLKGLKFLITGRLKGKTRTNTLRILTGSVPCQTISANINFTKMHAHTRYGVFGLKLWVHFKKKL